MSPNIYSTAKKLILAGTVKTLSEVLDVVPKTNLAREIFTTPERFNRLLENPKKFRLDDIYNIAQKIDVDYKHIVELIHAENLAKQEEARRKKKRK